MENYLIHTCTKRKWYVDEFLVPSLAEQGIENIFVYSDDTNEGLLTSFLKSYRFIGIRNAWHLQDDIIISSRFKELTEQNDSGVVCGFCNNFSQSQSGKTNVFSMWYSMPCIRIPGILLKEFVEWVQSVNIQNKYRHYIQENKHDDVLFMTFLQERYNRMQIINLAPNLVNHIDHLIGGSIVNKARDKEPSFIMAKYWDEPELLVDIEQKLEERRHRYETD